MSKAKNKIKYAHPGQPTKYLPEFCAEVEELGRQGKSQEQIAGTLNVVPGTLRNWAAEYPEFLLALTRAENFQHQWWEDVGQIALFADKFQAAVWSKSMAARFRNKYTEKITQEQSGINGGPIKHVYRVERVIVRAGPENKDK